MALLWPTTDRAQSRGATLIRSELDTARGLLKDRSADLEKAKRHVTELQTACDGLQEKIAGLERDESALSRGYIALMGDAAARS